MSIIFLNIMPFTSGDVPGMVRDYKRMAEKTGLTTILPSMTLHPEGDDPYVKADTFIKAYDQLKQGLAGTDIRLGVLLQSLIGHGWATGRMPSPGYQTTLNHTGKTEGRYCVLGEKFRKYCEYVVSSLARLNPELFLLDDDTRLIDNDKLECFCPLHLQKFSRTYTAAELSRLIVSSHPGDPILCEFEKIRRDTLVDFVRHIRHSIDMVNPAIPCGISGSGREQNLFGRLAEAAAGPNTKPFIRLGNALYFEPIAKVLPRRIYQSMVQKSSCEKVEMVLDESDTFPHNLYSKSAVGMFTHISAALLHGLKGGKIWIANFMNPRQSPTPAFEKVFYDNQKFFPALESVVSTVKWRGISIPLPNLEKNFHPLEYPDYFTCREWFSDVLGKLGIPVTFRHPDDSEAEAFIISSELLEHFTDSEIECLMKHNLFLDAGAAEKLCSRGFQKLLGMETPQECPDFSNEYDPAQGVSLRLMPGVNGRKLVPHPGSDILTELRFTPYTGCLKPVTVAPATMGFRNELGNYVITWTSASDIYTISPERQNWLNRMIDKLVVTPARCVNKQDVMCRCGVLPQGDLLVAVINLNYDVIDQLLLEVKMKILSVKILTSHGEWKTSLFEADGQFLKVEVPCAAYGTVVMKLVVD